MKGYHGRIAKIDLTAGTVDFAALDSKKVEMFLGGSGLGTAYLAEFVGPETDPLGPDNPLILMTGPFVDTPIPLSTRHVYVTLSPLTNIFAESSCGGSLAYHLKRSGLDGLIIIGVSQEPVVLVIDNQNIDLRPAHDLWGQGAFEVDEKLKSELDPKGRNGSDRPCR